MTIIKSQLEEARQARIQLSIDDRRGINER